MRHTLPSRNHPRHALRLHRPRPLIWSRPPAGREIRTSDLILAILGVCLLGALAMLAGFALFDGAAMPAR